MLRCPFKRTRVSTDAYFVDAGNRFKQPAPKRTPTPELPFDLRERQNVARIIRRARVSNFIGTVALMILFVSGVFALSVIRLSADPNYVRPW
ncbi:MAG TPA: hypothetical protein VH374_18585 [Polyangia bacterium]|jgi:hypothetical protein|nr:hypothetical protein [Polyangia bacterium]